VQLGSITRQYSGANGANELWWVPCLDHTGRVLTRIKIEPDAEDPWALRALINHSGIARPEGDYAVDSSDFEGLLMYINVKHAPGKVDGLIFVNKSFVSRDWAVQQNGSLALAGELFKNVRAPGTFKQVAPTVTTAEPAPGGAPLAEPRAIEPLPPPIQDPDEISPANYDQAAEYAESLKRDTALTPTIPPPNPDSTGAVKGSGTASEEMAKLFEQLQQNGGSVRG
jgi:hypothetical protein